MKTFLLAVLVCTLSSLTASAQTTPPTTQVTPTSTAPTTPAKIGPAPANSPQKQILNSALSPETRSTLQQAMNSST